MEEWVGLSLDRGSINFPNMYRFYEGTLGRCLYVCSHALAACPRATPEALGNLIKGFVGRAQSSTRVVSLAINT